MRQQYSCSVFQVEFDPPPSPPRTRNAVSLLPTGRRLIGYLGSCIGLVNQGNAGALPSRRDLKYRLEWRLRLDSYDPLLLLHVHIDGIQHREQQISTLRFGGTRPSGVATATPASALQMDQSPQSHLVKFPLAKVTCGGFVMRGAGPLHVYLDQCRRHWSHRDVEGKSFVVTLVAVHTRQL